MSSEKKCDFTVRHYREILETALKNGYKFIGYDDAAGKRDCILRHDVDYVPEWAVRKGEIESELGIKSTFFFQVCARTYNLRERASFKAVERLRSLGHVIGLHLDLTWNPEVSWEDVPSACEEDKRVLQSITGVKPCDIISFHNPHRFVKQILNQHIPGMRHTYEAPYFSGIKYLSDSQGWYEGCMCKIFEEKRYPVIQLLTHGDYWFEKTKGDFIADMAQLVKFRSNELAQYMVDYHPVCKKNEERLRRLVREGCGV
jgi:hypothetical protein